VDKKTLPIIVVLVLVVIFYWPILEFLGLKEKPKETATPTTTTAPADTTEVSPESLPSEPKPAEAAKPVVPAETPEQLALDTAKIDTVVVITDNYTVAMTTYGGGPISLFLNNYTYRDGKPIQMLPDAKRATPEATFAGGTFSTSKVLFSCDTRPGTYEARKDTLSIQYTYSNGTGGEILRTFIFYPDKYNYDLIVEVKDPAALGFERKYSLVWETPIGVAEPNPKTDYDAMEAVAMLGGSREKLADFKDGKLNQSLTGSTTWAGLRNKYFANVMIPKDRAADGAFAEGTEMKVELPEGSAKEKKITVGMDMPFASVPMVKDSFTVFVGPLDYMLMAKYDVGLQDMLDIGTTPVIGWIIKPFAIGIMWLLPKMYAVIPNYGFVIIIFALLVKIVTLPLSMKSFRSMQAMKDIQPKIEELKKKYKKDPQAMNKEMMALYKVHGVNPMSGCLPMIPQMPLFFALFSVFRSTILLRDAPFIWFINDLSRGATSFTDPYIVLVVVMIVAQYLSQKVTMGAQQQQKAFQYIMPLFMGFIFYKFAAGLVLYWTCFSLFSLLDYVLFKRKKAAQQILPKTVG
jgi:YidC/Oxa1 family membrane protein insertase